jgi:FMN phosphatase YigB (HAD superfamily)
MNIYQKSILRLIDSYGYVTREYPLIDLIFENNYFQSLLADLIDKKEIFKLEDIEGYVSKETYLRYRLIKDGLKTTSDLVLNNYKNLEKSITPKNIIFDLGGVIADESDLDVFICDYFDKNVNWLNFNWDNYSKYSEHLENELNPKWYDYYAQADELGIDKITIDNLHLDNIDLVHFYDGSLQFVKTLFEKGHKIFFMTGCNSNILKLRLEIYGLLDYISGYVTSDISNEIGNKENYFKVFFDKFKYSPEDCLLITDNFIKDGLPATSYGVETLLFIKGGRKNTEYNSQGLKPNDILSFSLLLKNRTNSPLAIFDSFDDLTNIIKTLPNK